MLRKARAEGRCPPALDVLIVSAEYGVLRADAPVQHRYDWRYLVGFVHPASGRTVFHLASSVSIPLFEAELAAFAREVGAGPRKQVVLVLDRAGWHASCRAARARVRAPAVPAGLLAGTAAGRTPPGPPGR